MITLKNTAGHQPLLMLFLTWMTFGAQAAPLDIALGEAFPQPVYFGTTTNLPVTIEPSSSAATVTGLSAIVSGGFGFQPIALNFDLVSHDCPGTITPVTEPVFSLSWTNMGNVSSASPIDCSIELRPRGVFSNAVPVTLFVDCDGCNGDSDDRATREIDVGVAGDMLVSLSFNESQQVGPISGSVTYRNIGLGEARDIVVSLFGDPALFVDLSVVGNPPGCNGNLEVTSDSRTWSVPQVLPGESVRCDFNTTIPSAGSYELFVLVSSETFDGLPDPWPDNNSDQVTMVATEFVVDTRFSFHPDANPGDGVCADSQGNCSLRAAVDETNALPGRETILIPYQAGGYFLGGLSNYLTITDAVILDGLPDPASGNLPWITRTDSDDAGLIRISTLKSAAETELRNLDLRGNPNRQLSVDGAVVQQVVGPTMLRNVKISGGWTSGGGGGLRGGTGLRLFGVDVFDNRAGFAGGLYLVGSAEESVIDVVMINLAVHDNVADGNAGGLFSFLANITIDRSSFYRNEAVRGGGLYLGSFARTLMTNSTIAENQAALSGGGIHMVGNAKRALLSFVTIAYNEAGPGDSTVGDGGGIFVTPNFDNAHPYLHSSILAFNWSRTTGGPFGTVIAGNCSGELFSNSYNTISWIDGDPDCFVSQPRPNDDYNRSPAFGDLVIEESGLAYYPLTRVNQEIDQASSECTYFPQSWNSRDNANQFRPIDADLDGEPLCDRGAIEARPFQLTLSTTSASPAGWAIELDNDLPTCGDESCLYWIPPGRFVTLSASPEPGTVFAGWGGACSSAGVNDCVLDMTQSRTVTANFIPSGIDYALIVQIDGQGTVSSQPAGIDCPSTCQFDFPESTLVTLTPVPMPGHEFSNWTGACTGQSACEVEMTQAQTVGAVFIELEDAIFSSRFEN